ncbi:MAG TPA: FKBP-type peptidyl-prolyl cis-trans isomerase [Acidimicrobiales bacterium]|jgi:peptidylprolyl isomerase
MPRLRTLSLAAVTGVALLLSACGNSTPPANASSSTTTTTAPATTTSVPAADGPSTTTTTGAPAASGSSGTIPVADRSPAGTFGKAPTVVVPTSAAPSTLESADLITGSGATAADGDSVTVEYVLATYSTHGVVQSSWTSQPFSFTLGEGQVIPGWDKGVVGMKVGGRRELIIPPAEGYGANSPGAGIAANDTLVFVIDLQKVS